MRHRDNHLLGVWSLTGGGTRPFKSKRTRRRTDQLIVHHSKIGWSMSAMGLGRVKTKSDLVVMPSGRQIFAFFCSQRDRIAQNSWKGKIQGHELESFDIIEENDEELIVDRTIAFRPMPAAKLFRDAMRAAMGSSIPDDFLGIFKLELQWIG